MFYAPPVLSCIFSPSLQYSSTSATSPSLNSEHHSSFNLLTTKIPRLLILLHIFRPLNFASFSPLHFCQIYFNFLLDSIKTSPFLSSPFVPLPRVSSRHSQYLNETDVIGVFAGVCACVCMCMSVCVYDFSYWFISYCIVVLFFCYWQAL